MSMGKQGVKTAVPKLRFPEFRHSEAWELKKLSCLLVEQKKRNKNLSFGPQDVLSVSGEHGCVNQIELLGRSYAGVSLANYHVVETGDIVYTKSPLKRNPFGIIKGNKGKVGVVSTLYAVYRATGSGHSAFLDHYFSVDYNINSYLQPIVRKGAKNDMKVNNAAVLAGDLFTPGVDEQKKVADFLTSLDEVIFVQGRKVEALKAHKRGLMQHLFPREGETRPHLRFPEFRDAQEWTERPLGQVTQVASGQVDPKVAPYCDFPHVGGDNIESETGSLVGLKTSREDGVTSGKYIFDESDVLYSKIRPILNKVAAPGFIGVCSADIYPIRPSNSDITRQFLVYLLRSAPFVEYAAKHSERGKIPKINREALAAYAARLPQPVEQQRIADCLFSLDTSIAAESAQLTALKAHKQGLMQQLFPVRGVG
ncbi:restriction endonuclease subunit S [Xanthomonas arboricola]|uniref:restriction endonuclease subunit S n=1 Tax=Xanthomonas arboricola TaxID=56448 RepID=UPI00063ED0B8|nr:restriction endonuclease subunit S [Xanthomonas arboricola]MBB3848390.1 type I restriction enzyme S subunit [Xanthomonas arboricola]PPT18052.1 restriction endonuclease subunit S [Xanthomonas arboricola]